MICHIEALCGLRCNKVITHKETGITYFEILEGKTHNAKRKMPLHDWIVKDALKQRTVVFKKVHILENMEQPLLYVT